MCVGWVLCRKRFEAKPSFHALYEEITTVPGATYSSLSTLGVLGTSRYLSRSAGLSEGIEERAYKLMPLPLQHISLLILSRRAGQTDLLRPMFQTDRLSSSLHQSKLPSVSCLP